MRSLLQAAILLLAVPAAGALPLGLGSPGEGAPAGAGSLDLQAAGVETGVGQAGDSLPLDPVDGLPVDVAVDLSTPPLALPGGVSLPGLPVALATDGSAGAAAEASDAKASDGPFQSVPLEVAAPVAAGGLAAAAAAAWVAFARAGLGALSSLPFVGRLFSRIEGPRVLDNPVRARLHDLIVARPGQSLDELRAGAGIAWGTAVHHLRRLESHGLAVSVHRGGRRLVFPANTESARHRGALATLAQPTAQRIARLVHDSPGLAQAEVCDQLGLQAPAVSKHLGRFQQQGLVAVRPDGRHRRYEPTDELRVAFRLASAA